MDTFQLSIEEAKLTNLEMELRSVKAFHFQYLYGVEKLPKASIRSFCDVESRLRQKIEKARRRVSEFQLLDLGGGG